MPMRELLASFLPRVAGACREHYGDKLVSLVVFGSAARGTLTSDSDLDLLIVASGLPDGRVPRVRDFMAIERVLAPDLAEARRAGWNVEISPVLKTPAEAGQGSALFLDMTEDTIVLEDRDAFMKGTLDRLRARLAALGARRVWRGNAWYWDLKPDYRAGEIFEI